RYCGRAAGGEWNRVEVPTGRGPDSGGHGVPGADRSLQHQQPATVVGRLVYAQGVPRRPGGLLQYGVRRPAGVRLPAQGGEPRQICHQPGAGWAHVPIECASDNRSRHPGGAAVSYFKDLFHRLGRSWGWVAAQFGGILLLILAGMGWTRLPDKHGWQVALTLLVPLLMAAAALALQAATMRSFADGDEKRIKLWWGALSLLVWI